MTTDKRNLLPIGTRVKHSNPSIAASFGNTEGTLVAYFVTGLGDHPGEKIISDIFPYRVHFDPVKDGSLRDIYPQGYEGLFTEDKIEAAAPAASIFPTDDALIVGRKWLIDIKRWTNWHVFTPKNYDDFRKLNDEDHHSWEFCFRDPVTEPA
jgi:hypothetical protein